MINQPKHHCRPLHVGGRLLCTRNEHFMQPVIGTAAQVSK